MRKVINRPIGNHVMIRRVEATEKTEGGVLKPSDIIDKDRPFMGEIIARGPGRIDYKMETEVGDIVHYPKFGMYDIEVEIDGKTETITIMREADLLCILEREEVEDKDDVKTMALSDLMTQVFDGRSALVHDELANKIMNLKKCSLRTAVHLLKESKDLQIIVLKEFAGVKKYCLFQKEF